MKKVFSPIIILIGIIIGYMIHYFVFCEIITRFIPYDSYIYKPTLILSLIFCIVGITTIMYVLINRKISKILLIVIIITYFLLLALMLFGRFTVERIFIINPLLSLKELNNDEMLLQSALNLGCFLPLGWIFRKLERKRMIIVSVLLAFSLELIQVITMRGMFDIFDALLYILGMYIGYRYLGKIDIRTV